MPRDPRPARDFAYFDGPRPLRFAHRGGAKLAPENTLVAFERGVAAGCDYIETDVHLTSDGHLIVFHDARVDRCTDGHGRVAQMSLRALQRLDAGHGFVDLEGRTSFRGKGVRILAFEEFAAWLNAHPRVRVNIEIKTDAAAARHALLHALLRHGLRDRALVASARAPVVQAFRRLARGRIASSAGQAEIASFWAAARVGLAGRVRVEYQALQVPVRHRGLPVINAAFVQAAHARGVHVHAWTIDDPAQMRRLLELKVDGIMTDRPDLLTELVGSAFDDRP